VSIQCLVHDHKQAVCLKTAEHCKTPQNTTEHRRTPQDAVEKTAGHPQK